MNFSITQEMISSAKRDTLKTDNIKQRGYLKAGDIFCFGEDEFWVHVFNELFANTSCKCSSGFAYHNEPVDYPYEVFVYECLPYIEDKGSFLQEKASLNDLGLYSNVPNGKIYAIFSNLNYFDPSSKGWSSGYSATKFLGLCRFNKAMSLKNNHVVWEKIDETVYLDETLPKFSPIDDISIEESDVYADAINGNAEAQYELSRMYAIGLYTEPNTGSSLLWLEKSANGNYPLAELKLGEHYLHVFFVSDRGYYEDSEDFDFKSRDNAFSWFEKAAIQGCVDAQVELAHYFTNRNIKQLDAKKALYWCTLAYNNGKSELKELYENLKETVDLMARAESGDAIAQCNLGEKYLESGDYCEGIEPNDSMAFKLFQKSANQGYPRGIYNLGECYACGTGTNVDESKAHELWLQAAELGDAKSMFYAWHCYRTGNNVEMNIPKALNFLIKSAELGYAESQLDLGYSYLKGKCLEVDYQKGYEWLMKAANNDKIEPEAFYYLAECYMNGYGVAKDVEEAKKWYTKAEEYDIEEATEKLSTLQ